MRKFASQKFMSSENGVENRQKLWLFFQKSWNIVQDSKFKISPFIFQKLSSRFSDFLFKRNKKLSGQIDVCFPATTYKSQCFKEV